MLRRSQWPKGPNANLARADRGPVQVQATQFAPARRLPGSAAHPLSELALWVVWVACLSAGDAFATHPAGATSESLSWHRDYRAAYREAVDDRALLLLFARDETSSFCTKFAEQILGDAQLKAELAGVTRCELPLGYTLANDDSRELLFRHEAFRYLRGGPGLVLIDLRDRASSHFGQVVSVFPLRKERPLTADNLRVILQLPVGTLTQRTLIYAVRTHPDRPASASGEFEPILAAEAQSHALHQARLNLQGHHHWETRFHRINGRLGRGLTAREVCAESWPGQDLVEAAEECVHSWRQSPGHWEIVNSAAPVFGYDMKLGSRGVWYGTGILAR